MASLIQWTLVEYTFGVGVGPERSTVLRSKGLQRVRYNRVTELRKRSFNFLSVFLLCWKINMGCLALELAALEWSLLSV